MTSYNTQKVEWSVDEMIAIVTKEEASMKKEKKLKVFSLSLLPQEQRI